MLPCMHCILLQHLPTCTQHLLSCCPKSCSTARLWSSHQIEPAFSLYMHQSQTVPQGCHLLAAALQLGFLLLHPEAGRGMTCALSSPGESPSHLLEPQHTRVRRDQMAGTALR